jgi:hypothetical protein
MRPSVAPRFVHEQEGHMKTSKHGLLSLGLTLAGLLAIGASPAFAEGIVKVDCKGNCSAVTLQQICNTFKVNSVVQAVACDETADPGAGSASNCGGTCTANGTLSGGQLLSAYCQDGLSFDAVVTCK